MLPSEGEGRRPDLIAKVVFSPGDCRRETLGERGTLVILLPKGGERDMERPLPPYTSLSVSSESCAIKCPLLPQEWRIPTKRGGLSACPC